MTRRLLADPDLPNKVAEGRLEDVASCSGCLYCWHERSYLGKPLRCRINASLGRELEYVIRPADKRKKVLVAGSGPVGMEAARVAALRGHEAVLLDKSRLVGGLMPLAAVVKDLEGEAVLDTIRYFESQLKSLGVTRTMGKELDPTIIRDIRPDVVVLAIGGVSRVPDIPGIEGPNVLSSSKLHASLQRAVRSLGARSLERLTRFWMPVGKSVVVIGGGVQGCQLAEFLIKRGRKVTIVETAAEMGEGLLAEDPFRLLPWLRQRGATLLTGVTHERITDDGFVIRTDHGKKLTLQADSIMIALPLDPAPDLGPLAEVADTYRIGDCREPGYMHNAIADGFRMGMTI